MTNDTLTPDVSLTTSVSAELYKKIIQKLEHGLVDVAIMTNDGKRIQFASFVLRLRGQYFATLFSSQFKESISNGIELDMSSDVFHVVLEFMCTDDCPDQRPRQ